MDPGQLAFESGEERFDRGVVVAVAGGTERLGELEVGNRFENARSVGRATVGVVHRATVGTPRSKAITSASETSSAVTLMCIAQPTTRRDDRSITAARWSQPSVVRNGVMSAAHMVRAGGIEVPATRSAAAATSGRPRRHRRRACTPTRPWTRICRDALAATPSSQPDEFGVDAGRTVGAARPRWISTITSTSSASLTIVATAPRRPGVEPRSRDSQDSTEPLDAVDASVLGDEPEAADRIVSWAK